MSTSTTPSELQNEFRALERSMRELLSVVESPSSNLDSITRAMRRCEEQTPDPSTILAVRRGCNAVERAELETALRRLVDLNAILSQTTERATALTTLALQKTHGIQQNLAALGGSVTNAPRLDFES
jgi:hypothetical protein